MSIETACSMVGVTSSTQCLHFISKQARQSSEHIRCPKETKQISRSSPSRNTSVALHQDQRHTHNQCKSQQHVDNAIFDEFKVEFRKLQHINGHDNLQDHHQSAAKQHPPSQCDEEMQSVAHRGNPHVIKSISITTEYNDHRQRSEPQQECKHNAPNMFVVQCTAKHIDPHSHWHNCAQMDPPTYPKWQYPMSSMSTR